MNANNGMNITSAADKVTIWLSPEIVNMNAKLTISVNGRRAPVGGRGIEPSLSILLEDARSRADRQHPFWARVDMPSGTLNEMESSLARVDEIRDRLLSGAARRRPA